MQGNQGQRVWDDDELATKAVKVFKEELAEMNRSGLPKIEDVSSLEKLWLTDYFVNLKTFLSFFLLFSV